MTTTPGGPAVYLRVVNGMWADPALGGGLLTVGIYWAQMIHVDGTTQIRPHDTAHAVFGDTGSITASFGDVRRTYDQSMRQLERLMLDDIRRYNQSRDPRNRPYGATCQAPMVRREGLCGKDANLGDSMSMVRDLDTGECSYLARCGRRCDWARQESKANRAAWDALGVHQPVPPANTGGVLRKHLPEVDWPLYWSRIDPRWVEPPERVPFVRPALRVIVTDDVEPAPDTARPVLTLVPSP